MGRSYRSRPRRLAAKLKAIRTQLGLTQTEMIKALDRLLDKTAVGQVDDSEEADDAERAFSAIQAVMSGAIAIQ